MGVVDLGLTSAFLKSNRPLLSRRQERKEDLFVESGTCQSKRTNWQFTIRQNFRPCGNHIHSNCDKFLATFASWRFKNLFCFQFDCFRLPSFGPGVFRDAI